MAPLAARLASARNIALNNRIRPCDLETRLGTRYTADSLAAIRRHFPGVRFVWLMGADNLLQIAAWERWPQIVNAVPVAVFDRPTYSVRACAAKAARRLARARIPERSARLLATMEAPAWVFLRQPLNHRSATEIRSSRVSCADAAKEPEEGLQLKEEV